MEISVQVSSTEQCTRSKPTRALGLGSVLTTRVRRGYEDQMREWTGLPEGWVTAAMIPLGWPMEGHDYGPTNRKPAAEVTHWEKWGAKRG